MQSIIAYVIFILGMSNPAFASGGVAELDEAFKQYEANKEVQIDENQEIESISDLIANEQRTIPQVLYVLKKIKNGDLKVEIQDLEKLSDIYEPRTFRSRYPEHWRYVKAIDYDGMVCNEIRILIAALKNRNPATD